MFSKWGERRRAREIRALLKSIEIHQHGFHALVGDFNTLAVGEILDVKRMPAWIRGLVWLSGRDIQRETIQIMSDANYLDGYRYLHPSDKGYSFPSGIASATRHVFVPKQFAERLLSCEVVTANAASASDHFPLLAQLEFD